MKIKFDSKNFITLGIVAVIFFAYVTFSAFIGGNLDVKKINVSVNFDKEYLLETTYPKFSGSWDVEVYPDGSIYDKDGKLYVSYLALYIIGWYLVWIN